MIMGSSCARGYAVTLFPEPSVWHEVRLKVLQILIVLRDALRRIRRVVQSHEVGLLVTAAGVVSGILLVVYWGFLRENLSRLSRTILDFAHLHPVASHVLHISIGAIPDAAFVLLAIAGLSYLMPAMMQKFETNRGLRVSAIVVFVVFGVAAVIMNSVNREDQERKDQEHSKIERENADRIYTVQNTVNTLQSQFIASRGKTNEIDRRKGILDSLRAEYALSRKDVPVSMITGNRYPPREWMTAKLKQMGETWAYIPPPESVSQFKAPTPVEPPDINIGLATSNDKASSVQSGYKPGDLWFQGMRSCAPSFKCYTDFDLVSQHVELHVGPKGWARMFLVVFNTGGTALNNPNISVNLAKGHGVSSIARAITIPWGTITL